MFDSGRWQTYRESGCVMTWWSLHGVDRYCVWLRLHLLQGIPMSHQSPEQLQTRVETWSFSLCCLSLSLSHTPSLLPPSPFPLSPLSFPFLLFESDTQSILITFKSEERQDQMFKSVVCETAVVSFLFTAWPFYDYCAASIGHISRGSWVAAVSCWRWPCVLQS